MFRRGSKRALDLAVVLILLPVALPLALIGGLAVYLEEKGKGSIFYSQTRIKADGKPFKIYKFRSMVTDAEKDGVARWASRNDSRVTRVGSLLRKGRLDELPQLFNVLRGDMSFVGPRPERPEFVTKLVESIEYYEERHRVKPGLTGWAQICYPYGDTEKDGLEKLQYDLYYVKNYSIFLDLLIILQTIEVVVLGKGAQ
jgi:exopolysaccharide biosynthesis polyprenyl glycosylphosphotransferase